MVHGLSCSAACGIFLDQGLNPCPLHWQADSAPPGKPLPVTFTVTTCACHPRHPSHCSPYHLSQSLSPLSPLDRHHLSPVSSPALPISTTPIAVIYIFLSPAPHLGLEMGFPLWVDILNMGPPLSLCSCLSSLWPPLGFCIWNCKALYLCSLLWPGCFISPCCLDPGAMHLFRVLKQY